MKFELKNNKTINLITILYLILFALLILGRIIINNYPITISEWETGKIAYKPNILFEQVFLRFAVNSPAIPRLLSSVSIIIALIIIYMLSHYFSNTLFGLIYISTISCMTGVLSACCAWNYETFSFIFISIITIIFWESNNFQIHLSK